MDNKISYKSTETEACTSSTCPENLNDLDEENNVENVLKTDFDKIYLFARNNPEKELWFHRLSLAVLYDSTAVNDPSNKKKNKLEEYNNYNKAYLAYIHNVYELSNYSVSNDNQKTQEVINSIFTILLNIFSIQNYTYVDNILLLYLILKKFQNS